VIGRASRPRRCAPGSKLPEGANGRFEGTSLTCNADMGPAEIRQYCQVDAAGQSLLKAAMQQVHLSARAYHRMLKPTRTIADLAGSEDIQTAHIAEAIRYPTPAADLNDELE
jgi:magnesium chelatase family protein